MPFDLSTPALLFPAISLLMLAYTNRFLSLAALARDLQKQFRQDPTEGLRLQILNLRRRVRLIRLTQAAGVLSFALNVASMVLVLFQFPLVAQGLFMLSLVIMLVSLVVSLWEIMISVRALEIELSECSGPKCKNEDFCEDDETFNNAQSYKEGRL